MFCLLCIFHTNIIIYSHKKIILYQPCYTIKSSKSQYPLIMVHCILLCIANYMSTILGNSTWGTGQVKQIYIHVYKDMLAGVGEFAQASLGQVRCNGQLLCSSLYDQVINNEGPKLCAHISGQEASCKLNLGAKILIFL